MRRTKRSWLRPWVYLPAILIMIVTILFFARTGGRPLTSTPKRDAGLVPSGILSRGTPAPSQRLPRNASKKPDAATQARLSETYGKLPLSFEANRGQTDGQVKFLSRGSGYTLFLTSAEAVLALKKPQAAAQKRHSPPSSLPSKREDAGEGTMLRMKLVGANPAPRVAGLEELPGKSNYSG